MNDAILRSAVIIAATLSLAIGTVGATQARDYSAQIARSLNHQLYSYAGNRACGKACSYVAGKFGDGAFDAGERFSGWYAKQTSRAGTNLRNAFRR